jgi:hypothetical protein
MSLLVYCVLNGHRGPARPSVRGVHNQPVWVLECGRLCAAVSDAENESDSGSPTDVRQPERSPAQLDALLAYTRTVEAFSRGETIVPMRYGCRLGTINEVRSWVAGRAAVLRGLLDRLEGCVEMGVRIVPSRACTPRRAAAGAGLRAAAAAPRNPGATYLAARRTELALEDWIEQAAQDARIGLCALARDCVMETAAPDSRPTASLYFLVEKARVTGFRAAFARIAAAADPAMLLSGPWPPYNFVCGGPASDLTAQVTTAPASRYWEPNGERGKTARMLSRSRKPDPRLPIVSPSTATGSGAKSSA